MTSSLWMGRLVLLLIALASFSCTAIQSKQAQEFKQQKEQFKPPRITPPKQ